MVESDYQNKKKKTNKEETILEGILNSPIDFDDDVLYFYKLLKKRHHYKRNLKI